MTISQKAMLTRRGSAGLLLAALASPALPAFADTARDKVEADRRAIRAMAGDYHVRFDFRETVSFLADYDPIDPKVSGGNESVRVITETPELISLQHILVINAGEETMLVKHWRQDWTYEPRSVLEYTAMNAWTLKDVPRAARRGAWAQTVWQTDDSPRYGGIGFWAHTDGVSRWISEETMRPLARRDAVRKPPYDHYKGTNRHAITPTGWVHEQDNAKIGTRDGKTATFAHEIVLNTYDRATDYNIAVADAYWAKTKEYWAAVRKGWDDAAMRGRGMTLQEEPENGSVTGPKLMGLADEINEGKTTTAAAVPQALTLIADATRPGGQSSQSR